MNPILQLLQTMVYHGLERLGRYYASYRGFVADNQDPEGMQRLRLVIPGIADNPMETWAWGKGQYSGKGYGCQVLPTKGDMVWVTFENGDPNFPIWEHGHFGEGEIPKEKQSAEIFWFKTPKGFGVEIDDEKEQITLEDIFGNQIIMNEKGISLGLKGKSNVFLGSVDKAAQASVLGDNLEKVVAAQNKGLLGALKGIKDVGKGLTDFATKMAAAGTPAGLIITLGTEVPKLTKAVSDSDKNVDESNKSITDLTKTIPGIKSSKIRINE